jgi:inosine-uridine nucleoside N-ribohydrolase
MMAKKIPVILDTDIGCDIDDTWALAMMLNSPELDVRLIATDTGDTAYRAKIVAKMLEIAGRTDIPVAVGPAFPDERKHQAAWVADYDLSRYPGRVARDGVGAIVETIMASPEPVTLICIGPVPNIAAALDREPRITQKVRFVGMHGSVRRGDEGNPNVVAEYNVVMHTPCCQKVFQASWDMTITPLDTCGWVRLKGEKYQKVRACRDPLIRALIENYRLWSIACKHPDFERRSSILFDTVAIYLAFSEELLVMEKLGIRVEDTGHTVIDDRAKMMNCAMAWKDLDAFEDLLVARLTKGDPG